VAGGSQVPLMVGYSKVQVRCQSSERTLPAAHYNLPYYPPNGSGSVQVHVGE
jgi:hypothetical protein